MRIFVNGFGRIGRSVVRAWALSRRRGQPVWPGAEITAINDIAAADMLAYLFEFDSIFGPWQGSVCLDQTEGLTRLIIDGHAITLYRNADISSLDLSRIDVVMECTGRAASREIATRGLRGGARKVLISGPSEAADLTLVLGANDHMLADQQIISNASCTTNALAPLARLIDHEWGLVTGSMTTVHCYTGSQPTIDAPAADFARSRAAALSMVPTTTSASKLVDRVLPHIAGRLQGSAIRVPTASVSCVDLAVLVEKPVSVAAVNAVFAGAGGVIGSTDRPLVSTDLRACPQSIVMALPETRITPQGLLRVFGWYDNEWGFSNRMLDVALKL